MSASPGVERFTGCLIGQALGDALGFPVEGHPPSSCTAYVEIHLRGGLAPRIRRTPYRFGQYTDDTQLAREMLLSYVRIGHFDPADYADRIAALFSESRVVGGGHTTEEAALRLAAGVAWNQAGALAPTNGSAMRAAPIGLIFHDDTEAMIAAARDQARITHVDPRCAAGAVVIAGAVKLALEDRLGDTEAVVAALAEWADVIDESFAREITRLPAWLELPPEEAGPILSCAGEPRRLGFSQGIPALVVPSVLFSLYAVLKNPADYWETICTAIAGGGDVDTTAGMAGAISGAALGLDAIPRRLAYRLTDQDSWSYDELVGLAAHAHAVKTKAQQP
jgi:ADP-ribosylglycohydrolase